MEAKRAKAEGPLMPAADYALGHIVNATGIRTGHPKFTELWNDLHKVGKAGRFGWNWNIDIPTSRTCQPIWNFAWKWQESNQTIDLLHAESTSVGGSRRSILCPCACGCRGGGCPLNPIIPYWNRRVARVVNETFPTDASLEEQLLEARKYHSRVLMMYLHFPYLPLLDRRLKEGAQARESYDL